MMQKLDEHASPEMEQTAVFFQGLLAELLQVLRIKNCLAEVHRPSDKIHALQSKVIQKLVG